MATNPAYFLPPPKIMREVVVVDELPGDDGIVDTSPNAHLSPDYEAFTDFKASVKSCIVGLDGQVRLTLAIPIEFKYDALMLTDLRGVEFYVVVKQPKRGGESGQNGNSVGVGNPGEVTQEGPFTFSE